MSTLCRCYLSHFQFSQNSVTCLFSSSYRGIFRFSRLQGFSQWLSTINQSLSYLNLLPFSLWHIVEFWKCFEKNTDRYENPPAGVRQDGKILGRAWFSPMINSRKIQCQSSANKLTSKTPLILTSLWEPLSHPKIAWLQGHYLIGFPGAVVMPHSFTGGLLTTIGAFHLIICAPALASSAEGIKSNCLVIIRVLLHRPTLCYLIQPIFKYVPRDSVFDRDVLDCIADLVPYVMEPAEERFRDRTAGCHG